jgi:ubiquinone/menaquinone biosynthesis C-methylase UbiE
MPENKDLFAGSIAEAYHRHLGPLIFDEYARELSARAEIPSGGKVLEIACGTGILTNHLRRSLKGSVNLVATDLNPMMVEAAKANVGNGGGIDYHPADGTALPFGDDEFDAIFCQFGVMFYPDKGQGYREAARVLRPGGSFVFSVWDSLAHNGFCGFVHQKVVEMFPEDPPAFLEIPFGYHDIAEIKAELQKAGFEKIEISVLPSESRAPSARDVALALITGSPLASQLAEMGVAQESFETVEAALIDAFGEGEVRAPMQSISITADLPV